MREIKFRVWDKDLKLWCNTYVVDSWVGLSLERNFLELEESNKVVMQYTGLKDKNGKEVYEGDIIKSDTSYPLEVYWMGVAWGVRWKDMGNQKEGIICDDGGDMTIEKGDKLIYFEIIGNIFENKGEK